MRIQQAEERKEIDIPISEIVGDGGKLNILPDVKKYFSIDYKPQNDKLTLVAGGFIGLIPINKELAIEIKPKFSISNLTHIVAVAEDHFNTLHFFSKKYQKSEDSKPVVFEFMAECLANELQALDKEGILKDYILTSDNTCKLKGRISINHSIKSLWSHGHFNKASINYYNFTADNPFNRLIKYTLNYCIRELFLINSKKIFLKEALIQTYAGLDSISLDTTGRECQQIINDAIKDEKISVLRKYYIDICEICRLILSRTGVDFDRDGSDLELSSFTLDMEKIFEKYLLSSIRLNRSIFPVGTLILDGNKEGRKKFYNQPSIGTGEAKPDIIITYGDKNRIIADAKYKTKSKETDRYQVISHALSYSAKIAVLIFPKDEKYSGESLVKVGSVGTEFVLEVYEYFYNLASEDLAQEEKKLAEMLFSLFQTES